MKKKINKEDSFSGHIHEIDSDFFYVIMYKDNAGNEIKHEGEFPIACLKPGQKKFLVEGQRLFLTTYKTPINKRGDTSKIRFMRGRKWTHEELKESKKRAIELKNKLHWE